VTATGRSGRAAAEGREVGVFTTVGCDWGQPILWWRHRDRLAASVQTLHPGAEVRLPGGDELGALLVERGLVGPARLRVMARCRCGDGSWRIGVAAEALPVAGPALPPLRLAVVGQPAPLPDSGHKQLDRTWLDRAREAARCDGADDALLVGAGGEVLETSVANVFVVRNGIASTSPAPESCLPGILRGWLLEHGGVAGVEPRVARVTVADVLAADEVWVTNCLVGVRRVAAVGDRAWSRWPAWQPLIKRGVPAPGWPVASTP